VSAQSRGELEPRASLGPNVTEGKQWAVFIAIDKYREWGILNNPVKDARDIQQILKDYYIIDKWEELFDEKATTEGIRNLFIRLKNEVGENDSVFVFHAGHGFKDEDTNTGAWIPYDAGNQTNKSGWILHKEIRSYLDMLPAKHVFLISDSCYSGDLLDPKRGQPGIISDYPAAYKEKSRQAMSSGASEEVDDESEFAFRLKQALLNTESAYITPDYLLSKIKETKTTRQLNTIPILAVIPNSGHILGGSFLFFKKNRPPPLEEPEDGLAFTIIDSKSVTITKYSKNAAVVNIPGRIQGLPVTTIGSFAFSGSGLTSVTIPSSVTAIGSYAFSRNRNLTSVTIPSSVTTIGNSAFSSSGLTSVTIPASVTTIGDSAFSSSSLENITVDSRNPSYASYEGILFDKNIKTIIQYPIGKKVGTYNIPPSVTTIGDSAFSDSSLTSVTIPTSVTTIGSFAFSGSGLTSVTIPSSVTAIGSYAFSRNRNLTSITMSRRTQVGNSAFPDTAKINYRD
jgi:hypothetical protein